MNVLPYASNADAAEHERTAAFVRDCAAGRFSATASRRLASAAVEYAASVIDRPSRYL